MIENNSNKRNGRLIASLVSLNMLPMVIIVNAMYINHKQQLE